MKHQLLIVANTPSDNTRTLMDAVAGGAMHPDIKQVNTVVKTAADAVADDVLASHAIVLGTTENFGYMSGMMKDFLERIYYPCLDQTEGRPYALYVRAGNDGEGARNSVERIITGLRWKAVQPALILSGDYQQCFEDECTSLGQLMAAGLDAGIF